MFKYSTISGPVAVAGLTLMLALGACSSGGDGPPATDTTDVTPEPMPEPAPPTDLETTQAAAMAAADAAKMASDAAAASAGGAEAATMNLATIQTGEMAEMYAMEARKYAGMAMAAYMDAKKASDDAAAATLASAAGEAKTAAEAAQKAAEDAAKMAGDKAKMAGDAAMMEVMVDGKMKSVGDTSIMIDGKTVTSGTGPNMAETGKTGDVSAMSMEVDAVAAVDAVEDVATTIDIDETKAAVVAKPKIDPRPINVGVVYDSPDDSARVRLVTNYIGSGTVAGVYTGEGTEVEGGIAQAVHGAYDHDTTDTGASPPVRILKASGMFYMASTVDASGMVAATTKGTPLYYYDVVTRNADGAVTDRTRTWLRRISTLTATDGTVTHNYNSYVEAGVATTLKGFPMAMPLSHLHYGVWNSLNEDAIADLGTGFVAATADGGGMTGDDMPNAGSATYNGQWVASVRGSGGDAVTPQSGDTMMTANFDKDTMKVELMKLATLEGTISGDTFKGTKVTGVMSDKGDLAVSADGSKYSGSFSGGFFGPKAAEAGGVFDYTSKNMAAGEFRGSFGGATTQ